MDDTGLLAAGVGLASSVLLVLLGFVVYQVQWHTKMEIYSKDHAQDIGEVKAQVLKMNGTQQRHTVEITQLQAVSHRPAVNEPTS